MKDVSQDRAVFDGTAYYYLKYRGQYSKALIDILAGTCHLSGKGRLLDLGCGTGKLTFPLASYFEEAIGIDISSDMLQLAQSQSDFLGIRQLKWVKRSSEDIGEDMGLFDLITSGDAFHWMDREKVLELCYDRLVPGGALALVGQGYLLGDLSQPWQQATQAVVNKWFGAERLRATGSDIPHEVFLEKSSFQKVVRGKIKFTRERDIKSIIGYLYSTSTCNKRRLGKDAALFERDLHQALYAVDRSGRFEEPVTDYYIIAFKEK